MPFKPLATTGLWKVFRSSGKSAHDRPEFVPRSSLQVNDVELAVSTVHEREPTGIVWPTAACSRLMPEIHVTALPDVFTFPGSSWTSLPVCALMATNRDFLPE